MKVPTDLTIPEIDEIRKEGVKALVERLGIAKAAFFLRETASQPLNYLEIKDQLLDKTNLNFLNTLSIKVSCVRSVFKNYGRRWNKAKLLKIIRLISMVQAVYCWDLL